MLRLPVALAAGAVLAAPAAAQAAPVLNPLKPCYVSVGFNPRTGETMTEDIRLAGSGFTPGSVVDVTVDGSAVASGVPVDAAGNLPEGTVKAPLQDRGQRPFDVVVAERDNPANTVTASSLITDLDVTVRPRQARPSQRIRFRGRGFTAGRPVYAHYVRRGKVRRTVRLASAPQDPCGRFSVRRRQFPFKSPRTGRWLLQIDQQRRHASPPGTPYYVLEILVRRVLRTR